MWSREMKRFVVTLVLLLGSVAFATQHVVSKFFSFSWTDYQLIDEAADRCNKFIEQGFSIVSVAINDRGYIIVYEDGETE